MGDKLKSTAILITVFLLTAFAYRIVWFVVEDDFLNRAGYWLWTWSSTDDLLNAWRMAVLGDFCELVMPPVVGLLGMGWAAFYLFKMKVKRKTSNN